MPRIVRMAGRYAVAEPLASGGAASVYLAVPPGSSSVQAIKRLHPHLALDPDTRSMLLDEARLVSHVRHPNVVPMLEVVEDEGDLLLVMEYVHGESLAHLMKEAHRRDEKIRWSIVSAIMIAVLDGLHAAHEARGERGEPLHIVHRDVSPQNILVGEDGRVRLIDFGVAKAAGRLNTTRDGSIKGKVAYMAPEHLKGMAVTRRVDIYGASVVLWEGLTGRRLFIGESEAELLTRVFEATVEPPSRWSVDAEATSSDAVFRQLEALDALTLRGLAHDPEARFATAREMAIALAESVPPAPAAEVAAWVAELAKPKLDARAATLTALLAEAQAVSTAAARAPAPPARHRWLVGSLGALTLVAACIGAFAIARSRDRSEGESIATTSSLAATTAIGATTATADDPLAPPADAVPDEPAAPRDAGLALVRLPASRAGSGATRSKASPRAKASGTKVVSPDCDPPYTRDPSGIILHKPQCID